MAAHHADPFCLPEIARLDSVLWEGGTHLSSSMVVEKALEEEVSAWRSAGGAGFGQETPPS